MNAKQGPLRSEDVLLQQVYWLKQLSGTLPNTTLCTDQTKHSGLGRKVKRFVFEAPQEVSEKIFKLSRNSPLSIYIILVSAFTLLLRRRLGEDDLIIGSPAYDPAASGDSSDNLTPLRFTIMGDPTFKEHLGEVKRVVLEAYSNAAYPFESLVERLGVMRDENRFPLFDIIVSLGNLHDENSLSRLNNNLTLSFRADAPSITGEITYNAQGFSEDAVRGIADHLINVLSGVLTNLDIKLSKVRLHSLEEEHRLLVEFNDSARDIPTDKTAPEFFEEQVKKTPNRVAAAFGDQTISYAELNAKANRLAHRLQSMGVGREVLVAVLARRSLDFLTTMLAIFKAGGAYLPLDPTHPRQRIYQVLSQSQAALVLGEDEFLPILEQALENVPTEKRPPVAPMKELLQGEGSEENLPPSWEPNSLSYVIYTSGSTGLPKGAMIEHAGMRNHLYAKALELQITESDIVGQNAPQCFDVSIWQFLSVLLVGGQVRIANDEIARDIPQLLKMMQREKITILEIVPSQMRAMLEVINLAGDARPDLSALRWLIVNGEVLPPELCRQWFAFYPTSALINAYGHTECSDDETHYALTEAPPNEVLTVPIGRPLPNLRLYLLDRDLAPVPIGVPGEAYVGGVGVGRGYLNDPERTARVYLPDPFSSDPGTRLYKTGDLAIYLPDGNLEFVSRVDFQVKVRGFRIELGEIESVLERHAAVRESVAVVREDEPGQPRVVAYVAPKPGAAPTTSELHTYVRDRLPEYMVPSAFVMLDQIPLNQNGKVDRRALPAPDHVRPELSENFVEPQTPVEKIIADIWRPLLGVQQIGVHDNFFVLGGHSLLATQVISRVCEAFQVALPLRKLFEFPTIKDLSLAVTQMQLDEMRDEEMVQILEGLKQASSETSNAALSGESEMIALEKMS